MFLAASANAPKAMSLAASPAAIVSPKSPMAAASRDTVPLTRPSVIGCGLPFVTTRIAASMVVGRCSDLAKLLKVPIEMMPTGCLVSTSRRTTQPTVPSPPHVTTVAVGVRSFCRSILGSNSTTRLSANALRILASTSGLNEPALELRTTTLVARAARVLTALIGGARIGAARSARARAAHQLDPPRARQGMEAQRDDAEGDHAQEHVAERLAAEEHESAAEPLDLGRVVVQASLHDEPADHDKDHAASEHAEAAQCGHELASCLAHLGTFEVSLENGAIGFDELPDADAQRDQAEPQREGAACRMIEEGGDGLLRPIAGGIFGAGQDLETEHHDQAIRQCARQETQPRHVAGWVAATMQGIENRPYEPPDRIGGQPDDDHEQDDPPVLVADHEHEACGQVEGMAAWLRQGDPQREDAHDHVQNSTHGVAEALEELKTRVGRRALDRTCVCFNCRHLLEGRTANVQESANF